MPRETITTPSEKYAVIIRQRILNPEFDHAEMNDALSALNSLESIIQSLEYQNAVKY